MKRLFSVLGVLGFTLSLAAGQASANIVYNFSSVTFNDGGTLTGFFTTNDARNALLGFDITTSAGGGFGFHYTAPSVVSFSSLPSILVLETPTLSELLQVTFTNLTAAGSLITIGQFDSFEQNPAGAHRQIVAGQVLAATSVPEPSALSLAVIGLLGMLGFLRRRT